MNPVHGTLTANTVATVVLDDKDYRDVEILNRDGAFEIFVLVDSDSVNPTVAGGNCEILPAAVGTIELPSRASGRTTVKLISTGAAKYSVRGL